MTTWCYNRVHLTHEDPKMINRVEMGFEDEGVLNEFIPIPTGLVDASQAQRELNIVKYGYPTYHEFCVAEWGTKWDVGGSDDVLIRHDANNVTIYFDSASTPPIIAYSKLSDLGFLVDGIYYEPENEFCGRFMTETGDYTISIDGDDQWVVENIDPDIVETFNMVPIM